jgi:NADPH:quinone reductase-like Zn-dependent oxidoreductase
MWVTSRDEAKGAKALEIGAERAFGSGERLPERVDAVMETVGAATWSHSVNSLKPGGTIVICGATSGDAPAKADALCGIHCRVT